ncbi:MAG: transporter substrate-binding domain-containing protein [Sneathiella sp.]|nr:transporter substrate-binding domain-containing protein [Sneathiella sp.]
MAKRTCLILLIFSLLTMLTAQAQSDIILAHDDSTLNLEGQPTIECVLNKMKTQYSFIKVPWKRAQFGTKDGNYAGFFMASQNSQRNSYATFSQPFMKVVWVYVIRKGSDITTEDSNFGDKLFASKIGSSRQNWLLKKYNKKEISHKIFSAVTSVQLLKMLSLGRVDIVLENQANLKKITLGKNVDLSEFDILPALEKPLGVYFSHAFLKQNPNFLNAYNTTIEVCIGKDSNGTKIRF